MLDQITLTTIFLAKNEGNSVSLDESVAINYPHVGTFGGFLRVLGWYDMPWPPSLHIMQIVFLPKIQNCAYIEEKLLN